MKYEVEKLYEGLEEQKNGDGEESLVICELHDRLMREFCFNFMRYQRNTCKAAIAASIWDRPEGIGNVSLVFAGQDSLPRFVSALSKSSVGDISDTLRGGWVKSIRCGGHFDDNQSPESLGYLDQLIKYTSLSALLQCVSSDLEELNIGRFALNESTAKYLSPALGVLSKVDSLTLGDLRCSASVFTELLKGIVDGMPSLRCLAVWGNKISAEAALKLKDIIVHHPKLVYVDVSLCDMDINSFERILDGCELSGSMQVLKVEMTVAASVEGVRSLERRLSANKLNLLNVTFHAIDNAGHFIDRLLPHLARNWEEYKSINCMRNTKIESKDILRVIPRLMHSISDSPDGVENIYKCLIRNDNKVLGFFQRGRVDTQTNLYEEEKTTFE